MQLLAEQYQYLFPWEVGEDVLQLLHVAAPAQVVCGVFAREVREDSLCAPLAGKRGAGEGEERTSDALPQMYTGSSSERLPHEQVEEPTGDALPQMYPGGSAVRLPREQVDSAARRRRVRLVFSPDHRGA